MSGAERQRRYRERRQNEEPTRRYVERPTAKRKLSRPQRWKAAVAELQRLQDEYQDWLDSAPKALHDTTTGQRLQAITALDLEELAEIEPPRGYGRD